MHKFYFLIGLLGLNPVFALIDEQQFATKVLNALKQERTLETSKIDVEVKRIELRDSLKNYADWTLDFALGLGYNYQDVDRNTTSSSTYDKKKVSVDQSAGLRATKRFLHNPSDLSLSLKSSPQRSGIERYKQALHTTTYYTDNREDVFSVAWTYPLLKHDSNASALKTYHRNILDLEKQRLSFYEDQEDFLADKLQDYLTWAYSQYEADIFTQYLQVLKNVKVKDKRQQLILQTAMSKTQNDILNAQEAANSIQQGLAIAIGQDFASQKATLDFDKQVKLIANFPSYLADNNRDLQKQKLDQGLRLIDIRHYQNQNLPTLDFGIAAEKLLSDGNTQSSLYNNDKLSYTIDLTFKYPLFGGITNDSKLQVSLLKLEKLRIGYHDKLQDLHAQLSQLNITLASDKKSLLRYLELIDFAKQNSAIEQDQFTQHGKNLRVLIDALDEEKEAKIEYLSAVVDYQKQIIDYNNLLDRIIIYQPNLNAVHG